jgi:hypothetical protein
MTHKMGRLLALVMWTILAVVMLIGIMIIGYIIGMKVAGF